METIVMTKDELIEKVKVYRYMDMPYIRIIDIPNPYRSEFVSDSYGSTCPLIPEEGECHYSWDWEKWLRIRFRESYKLRFPDQYKYISDEECSAEYFWRKLNVKNQINNDIKLDSFILDKDEWRIVMSIDGKKRCRDIMEEIGSEKVKFLNMIEEMYKKGIIFFISSCDQTFLSARY